MDFFSFIKTDILETMYYMFKYDSKSEDSVDQYSIFVNTLIDKAPKNTLKFLYYLIEYNVERSRSNKCFKYEHIYQYVRDFLEISYLEKNNDKNLSTTQKTAIELTASISTNLILTIMNNAEFLRLNKSKSLFQYLDSIH